MSKITIEGYNVDAVSGHLYLVYEDNNGQEWVLRAGPGLNGLGLNKLSVIGATDEGALLLKSPDSRTYGSVTESPEQRGSITIPIPSEMSAESAWSLMKQYAAAIDLYGFYYDASANLWGYNSNSFAGTLLNTIGIDINKFIPDVFAPLGFVGVNDIISVDAHIKGTDGSDIIHLEDGNDFVDAGAGNDVIYGGGGSDWFMSGPGTDYFNGDTDHTIPNQDTDTLSYQNAPLTVTVDLSAMTQNQQDQSIVVVTQDGFGGIDVFKNIEHVILSKNDDKFVFSDKIYNTNIEHIKVSGGGHAGIGDTAIFAQSNHHVEVVSGQIIVPLHDYTPNPNLSPLENLENAPALWLEDFDILVGSNASDTIQFGDTLWFANGGGGNDQFFGFAENKDTLGFGYHATSPDIMVGANGAHVSGEQIMVGGVGDDLFVAGQLAEVMVGQDANLVMMNGQMTLLPFTLNTNMDTLSYERSNAGVTVVLKDQADVSAELVGGYAEGDKAFGMSNVIGSAFSDTLAGNSGMNTIKGGAGNDYIYGMGGNDIIDAGSGINEIWTGSGNDLVIVNTATGPQATIVHDFELLSDHLSVDVHHVTGYSLQNSHTIDGVSGRFIDPGLATISFDDGSIITLNVLAAQGYQGQGIYDLSIFA